MTTTYRIEMMTKMDRCEYLSGSNDYAMKTVDIYADSPEKALEIAHAFYPEMVLNENYVRTVPEIEAEKAANEAYAKARAEKEQQKKAEAKARKEAREAERAEALNVSIEEYREICKCERAMKKLENEISELSKELARKKAVLTRKKNELAKMKRS